MAMKMTHISKTLLSIVCTLWGMSACSDDYNKYDDCPACNYYPVAVGNSTGTPVHAIGVEMDPHFFSQNITRNDGSKAEDWENIVVQRVKKMKVYHRCPPKSRGRWSRCVPAGWRGSRTGRG